MSSHPTFDNNLLGVINKLKSSLIIDLGCEKGKLGMIILVSGLKSLLPSTFHLTGVNPLLIKAMTWLF